jgi:hypothetical protein
MIGVISPNLRACEGPIDLNGPAARRLSPKENKRYLLPYLLPTFNHSEEGAPSMTRDSLRYAEVLVFLRP